MLQIFACGSLMNTKTHYFIIILNENTGRRAAIFFWIEKIPRSDLSKIKTLVVDNVTKSFKKKMDGK